MKLVLFSDHRYVSDADGSVWSKGSLGYPFLQRYLRVFDAVVVVSRMQFLPDQSKVGSIASGPRISFAPTTYWSGSIQLCRQLARLRRDVSAQIKQHHETSVFLIRMPSIVGGIAAAQLCAKRLPFGMEIVGDPEGVFGWGRPLGPIGLVLQKFLSLQLRYYAKKAVAVGYVPSRELVAKYPAAKAATTQQYSSVVLDHDAYSKAPRKWSSGESPNRLVTIASLSSPPRKGISTLLQCIWELERRGVRLSVTIVGDGDLRKSLEREASDLGVSDSTTFLGHVPAGAELLRVLDASDLFVLPSTAGEGLPRALLEAMARGLPCIATPVGGVPEVLGKNACAEVGSPNDLADKILHLLTSIDRLTEASRLNWMRAKDFSVVATEERAHAVYTALKNAAPDH